MKGYPQHRLARLAAPTATVAHSLAALIVSAAVVSTVVVPAPAQAAVRRDSVPVQLSVAPTPTVVEVDRLGFSVQGRPILAYRLGDPTAPTKAIVLGQMHGDEHAGVVVAQSLIDGPPLAGVDLWVVPTMNPDGDAADIRFNAHGVDLNRNWPDLWTPHTGNFYPGPAALSEPETRAMFGFIARVQPDYLVSMHQPLDGVDTTDGGARDPGFAARLARNLGLPLKPFRCWSTCYGSMTGWITDHQPGVAVTVEFPAAPASALLRSLAGPAIVHSVPTARFATAADRTPKTSATITLARGPNGEVTVVLTGAAWDPDRRATPLDVRVFEGAVLRYRAMTKASSATLNRAEQLSGRHGFVAQIAATPGLHRYCVMAANIGLGHRFSTPRCLTVAVPATA